MNAIYAIFGTLVTLATSPLPFLFNGFALCYPYFCFSNYETGTAKLWILCAFTAPSVFYFPYTARDEGFVEIAQMAGEGHGHVIHLPFIPPVSWGDTKIKSSPHLRTIIWDLVYTLLRYNVKVPVIYLD